MDIRIFPEEEWQDGAAAKIASELPATRNLVITGGTTAARLYPALAARTISWAGMDIYFSDERVVTPSSPDSNYRMARETLLSAIRPRAVHRIRGELSPQQAAREYGSQIEGCPIDLAILSLGPDAHVAGLFPSSPAIFAGAPCVAVSRPDGMSGVTLTPRILTASSKVFLIATGTAKANAVTRVRRGNEAVEDCPARIFADHSHTTMLVDDAAANEL